MHIILDTNIIVDNFRLDTPKFLGLFSYLKKTNSKLFLPSFVLEEVIKKYKDALIKHKDSFEKENRVNVEDLVKSYSSELTTILFKNKVSIIKPKDIASRKIFSRALKAEPPFDASGRGVRDTLIWLSIVNHIKISPKGYFCFISANTKDFGNNELHQNLKEDLKEKSNKFLYCNSLEEFLSTYGDKVAFIDQKYLYEFFEGKKDYLTSLIKQIRISSVEGITPGYSREEILGISIDNIDVQDFYIYGATTDAYKVLVEISICLEVQLALTSVRGVLEGDLTQEEEGVGYSYCWIDIPTIVNKKDQTIEIDSETAPQVSYAI